MAYQPPPGGGPPPGYPPNGYPPQPGQPQQGYQQGQPQQGYQQGQPQQGYQQGQPQQGYQQGQGWGAQQPSQHPHAPGAAGYSAHPPPVMGQAQPMPARPAKSSNTGVVIALGCGGLLVAVSMVGALLLFSAGKSQNSSEDDDVQPRPAKTTKAEPKPKPATDPSKVWIKSTRPNLRFLKPPGWKQTSSGRWGVFKSPDGNAVLAFAGFNRPNESTKLIGHAAQVLGVNRVRWKKTTRGTLGKDRFPARVGSGVCNFRGAGLISYATVNPGGSDQLLIVYTVSARGNDTHKRAVRVSLDSLQRR